MRPLSCGRYYIFCFYWGLMKCQACCKYHEQHDEYEIERFPGPTHPKIARGWPREEGSRKYFVRWAGDTVSQFEPLLKTSRLAQHGGCYPPGFRTLCVLAEPTFDPYFGEPCGPLISHKDIDAMDSYCSPKSINTLLASVDLAVDQERVAEVMRLADELCEKRDRAIAKLWNWPPTTP